MESDFKPRYRHPVELEGRLQTAGRTPMNIRVRNLSMAGAMLEHPYRLIPGQVCLLALEVAGEVVRLAGRVVWSRPVGMPLPEATGPCRSGLFFDVLPQDTEIRLRQFLTNLLPLPVTASRP